MTSGPTWRTCSSTSSSEPDTCKPEAPKPRAALEQATSLGDAVLRAGELSARTVIFDVEPLVAHWDGSTEDLDEGIARVLRVTTPTVPGVAVVCFSTNSGRRPSRPPSADMRVTYLASAGKPLRTKAYRGFPRPGVVVGDQLPTDGILARRLRYAFIKIDHPVGVPAGPRLMAVVGWLMRPQDAA